MPNHQNTSLDQILVEGKLDSEKKKEIFFIFFFSQRGSKQITMY